MKSVEALTILLRNHTIPSMIHICDAHICIAGRETIANDNMQMLYLQHQISLSLSVDVLLKQLMWMKSKFMMTMYYDIYLHKARTKCTK